jgi:hypothetical protein
MKRYASILLVFCILATSSLFAQDARGQGAPVPATNGQGRPRVFVTDEPLREGTIAANRSGGYAHFEGGPNARVVEVQSHLVKVCPQVTVTNRQDMADFILLFRRQGGQRSAMFAFGGLAGLALSAASKVDGASLFSANGDMITATKQRTVGNAIREICTAIPLMVEHADQRPIPAPRAQRPVPAPGLDAQEPADARGCVQHGQYLSCTLGAGEQ